MAEELHFARAASRLHVAQPPLSRTIRQLEHELGARLFERNTRSVSLTAAGQALVEPTREVLDAVRRAEAAVRSVDGEEAGLVRIAFAGLSTHSLIARLARGVRSRFPGIQLELSSQNFAQPAMKMLLARQTDIVLGRWDVIPREVAAAVVLADDLVIAVPDTHPLAGADRVQFGQFADDGFVSLPADEGAVLRDRLQRLSQAAGFVAEVVQVAPDTQTALALVGAEVGCHLTLASVARNATDPHVTFVPLDAKSPDVDLQAAWRRDDHSPAARAVLDELLKLGTGRG